MREQKPKIEKKTQNFKIGDKVHVAPNKPSHCRTCYIRAVVTKVGDDKDGYELEAFEEDLPGIYMFNVWDALLLPRIDENTKPLPDNWNDPPYDWDYDWD